MLTRAGFGVAAVLATVSGSLALPRAQAVTDTQTVYNPFGADIAGTPAEPAPTVWGSPYLPPRAAD
jgi:hypothetical protein